MRIGVISDTHGNVRITQKAITLLESLGVKAVLHCGDVGTPEIIERLGRCNWPIHFVQGNCDYEVRELAQACRESGQHWHGMFADLELAGVRIALLHSHDEAKFAEVRSDASYKLVCYGHTHRKLIERVGDRIILNPGALHRADPHSIAIVDLPQLDVSIIDL